MITSSVIGEARFGNPELERGEREEKIGSNHQEHAMNNTNDWNRGDPTRGDISQTGSQNTSQKYNNRNDSSTNDSTSENSENSNNPSGYIFVKSLSFKGIWSSPRGVAVHADGTLYVADLSNHIIRKFDSSGTLVAEFGSWGTGEGQFWKPRGLAIDHNGDIYVADSRNNRIQKFDSHGTFIGTWGAWGPEMGEFEWPLGVAVDRYGYVYVIDSGNNRIQKFDSAGTFIIEWRIDDSLTFSGDTEARLPQGIAVDRKGNVFVADTGHACIRQFDDVGNLISTWGREGQAEGEFSQPGGISVDCDGNLYVADTGNARIQKFSSNGTFITMWGRYGSGEREFKKPYDVTLDRNGTVYVADSENHRIQIFAGSRSERVMSDTSISTGLKQEEQLQPAAGRTTGTIPSAPEGKPASSAENPAAPAEREIPPFRFTRSAKIREAGGDAANATAGWELSGKRSETETSIHEEESMKKTQPGECIGTWGIQGTGKGEFKAPFSISIDADQLIYVADSWNNRIQKFDENGNIIATWGHWGTEDGQFQNPEGVAADTRGNVFVADTDNNRIQKFDTNGKFITQWGLFGSSTGRFNSPLGIATDSSGFVYVVEYWNNRVQKFATDGRFIEKLGSFGSGDGQFIYPRGIAIDTEGNIYVADIGNHRIQKFSHAGAFLLQWGSEGTNDGEFKKPEGVAVDSKGYVYVADTDNHRIQVFDKNGRFITKWGEKGTREGYFSRPHDLAIDGRGNVYVVDTENHRIQKFSPVLVSQEEGSAVEEERENLVQPEEPAARVAGAGDAASGIASLKDVEAAFETAFGAEKEKPVADFTATPFAGSAPLAVRFSDRSKGSPRSWFWEFGDGSTSEEQNPQRTYETPGIYPVSLTVTNPDGRDTRTKEEAITVTEAPQVPFTDVSRDAETDADTDADIDAALEIEPDAAQEATGDAGAVHKRATAFPESGPAAPSTSREEAPAAEVLLPDEEAPEQPGIPQQVIEEEMPVPGELPPPVPDETPAAGEGPEELAEEQIPDDVEEVEELILEPSEELLLDEYLKEPDIYDTRQPVQQIPGHEKGVADELPVPDEAPRAGEMPEELAEETPEEPQADIPAFDHLPEELVEELPEEQRIEQAIEPTEEQNKEPVDGALPDESYTAPDAPGTPGEEPLPGVPSRSLYIGTVAVSIDYLIRHPEEGAACVNRLVSEEKVPMEELVYTLNDELLSSSTNQPVPVEEKKKRILAVQSFIDADGITHTIRQQQFAAAAIQVGALGFCQIRISHVHELPGATHFRIQASPHLQAIGSSDPVTFVGTGTQSLEITDVSGSLFATGTFEIPAAYGIHEMTIILEKIMERGADEQ